MTTYTVLCRDVYVVCDRVSLRDAAHEILTYDGCEYEVRQDQDGGWTLWTRQQVANRPWGETRFFSLKADRAEAEAEIFDRVVTDDPFNGPYMMPCYAITDKKYAEMLASEADDESDDEMDDTPAPVGFSLL